MPDRPLRISPQPPEAWSPATRSLLEGVVPTGAVRRPVTLPAVIAHHPTYLAPYLGWAKAIALHGVLTPRDNALLALRTGWNCGSEFEWGVHAETAPERAGLTDAELEALAGPPDAGAWSPRDRALLRAADELHETATVTDATWAALAEHLDEAGLLEVVFVVGHYTMLSMVANASGVRGRPDWRTLPGR